MRKTLSVAIVMVFLGFAVGKSGSSTSPQEEDYTGGNWLLVSCQVTVKTTEDSRFVENTFESYRDGYCRGLVAGVADASPHVCPPRSVTHGQQVKVVLKYLQDHPEELHLHNSDLVEKSLAK